jgi:hypothetical protein
MAAPGCTRDAAGLVWRHLLATRSRSGPRPALMSLPAPVAVFLRVRARNYADNSNRARSCSLLTQKLFTVDLSCCFVDQDLFKLVQFSSPP